MTQTYNIYCDESGHIENDNLQVMVLGGVWCLLEKTRKITLRVKEIKVRHGLAKDFEVKWTKISPSKISLYMDLVDYFFDTDDLHFRAVVIPDKSLLRHSEYGQTHDDWYYKMYFEMLKLIIDPTSRYRIYLDIKDTRGGSKVEKLHEVLANAQYDFSRQIIERIQIVRSQEVQVLQIADLLIGAVSYANRELSTSSAKLDLIARIKERSGYSLKRSTLLKESKFNLLRWRASEG